MRGRGRMGWRGRVGSRGVEGRGQFPTCCVADLQSEVMAGRARHSVRAALGSGRTRRARSDAPYLPSHH